MGRVHSSSAPIDLGKSRICPACGRLDNMDKRRFLSARILIVDDEPSKVRLISGLLEAAGYGQITSETDSAKASSTFESYEPDLVILDLHMAPKDGFAILHELELVIPEGTYLPVLVLTGDVSTGSKERALDAGAMDFLAKPFSATEIMLRVKNLLHTRALHLELAKERNCLEDRVRERTEEVVRGQGEILDRLAMVSEFRDDATGKHTKRVSEMVRRIAADMEFPPDEVELMAKASLLHDIGKIAIPDDILLKPGKLTPEEFDSMKNHVTVGGEILRGSDSELLRMAESIARFHHERWDGTGYGKVEGMFIPIAARITAVADVFDALMTPRPYKEAWELGTALAEIERLSGSHFDPEVVASFLRVVSTLMPPVETNGHSCAA